MSVFKDSIRTCVVISGAMNEWQNDRGAVSVFKDSIRTCVVTVDATKHFIILIETLSFKRFTFSVHKAA